MALRAALDDGYRLIDTAFAYGNEAVIGKVLHEYISDGKIKREDLFITTKARLNFNVPKDFKVQIPNDKQMVISA